jgi:hypothetical protein
MSTEGTASVARSKRKLKFGGDELDQLDDRVLLDDLSVLVGEEGEPGWPFLSTSKPRQQ